MHILIVALILGLYVVSDAVECGWKGIKPMDTANSAVDQILGTPKVDESGYYGYSTSEAFVQVNYSSKPCIDNQYGRGRYNVPAKTVLGYIVNFRRVVKLSDLDFKRDMYYRDAGGDVTNFVSYISYEHGIVINVNVQQGGEFVSSIEYRPSKADIEKFACGRDRMVSFQH